MDDRFAVGRGRGRRRVALLGTCAAAGLALGGSSGGSCSSSSKAWASSFTSSKDRNSRPLLSVRSVRSNLKEVRPLSQVGDAASEQEGANGRSLSASSTKPSRAEALTNGLVLEASDAVLVLGLVTVLWGSQHAIIKSTLADGDVLQAACLNFLRFGLASLCFCPWLPSALEERRGVRGQVAWKAGAELGFWLFLGFCLQAVGLLYTTAQRSGVLLYLNVKLVPFFAFSLFGRSVPTAAWVSALGAFLGTFLVASDGQAGVPLNLGDLLTVLAASASAMFILRLETFAPVTDPRALNAVSTVFVALLCVPWVLFQAARLAPAEVLNGPLDGMLSFVSAEVGQRCSSLLQEQLFSVIYLGVLTTAFTNWLQTIGQKSLPATTASAIYALDPLWGAFFAYLWLGEALGLQGLAGCALLFAVWAYQFSSTQRDQEKQP